MNKTCIKWNCNASVIAREIGDVDVGVNALTTKIFINTRTHTNTHTHTHTHSHTHTHTYTHLDT